MVLALCLLATQLAAGDSAYASEALRALVTEAAAANREIPASLATYRVHTESEVAFAQAERDSELVAQIEQIAAELRWRRPNGVEQRVVGYRAGTPAISVSALSYLRRPWLVPTLYGNELRVLLSWRDLLPAAVRGSGRPVAVHPFSDRRNQVYRFDGGDTLTVSLPGQGGLRVIRIRVTPWAPPSAATLLFRGEVDVDAASKQIVRMRGHLVVMSQHPSTWVRLVRRGIQTVAVVELVNEQREGYWLPTYQRLEVQARSPLAKELRAALRIVTQYSGYVVNDASPRRGSKGKRKCSPDCLTVARRDSISQFTDWLREPGAATAGTRARDFDDVTSDTWGPSRPSPDRSAATIAGARQPSRLRRAYGGIADGLAALDRSGLSVNADAGRTWADGTTRGSLALQWHRVPWRSSLFVERPVLHGGGLLPALGEESSVLAFRFGTAAVDRGARTIALMRELGGPNGALVHLDAGPASDPAESMWSRAFSACAPSGLTPNYAADVSRNLRSTVVVDLHPDVSADRRTSGVGAGLTYEHVDCQLRTQRLEARVLTRSTRGPMTYAARLDGASLSRWRLRPQPPMSLDTYDGFARGALQRIGSQRAALLRLSATYELPHHAMPVPSLRWLYLPSTSPSVSLGLQSGWSDSFIARPDSSRLLASTLVSRQVEGRFRSAFSLTVQPFGGAIGVGVARRLDHGAGWGLVFSTDTRW